MSALAMISDWTAPFPLVHLPDGSYSISPWDDRVFFAGLASSALTIMLASLGRGKWRLLTIVLGVVFLVFSFLGFLGSHH